MEHGPSVPLFVAQIIALLVTGRLMGEFMQRMGQPPVMGQLIAGILLGPSVFGAIAPSLQHTMFPSGPEQKAMLDAVAQLGILLLLLMTGMETDLSVFRDAKRTALSISLSGIVVPFVCGITLGMLLPESLLPDPHKRLITTLFLGTALSISSVKIVALVVRDLGFLRRTVGQTIIAAAILDDTIGWIIMSVTFGLAAHGSVDLVAVSRSVLGTALFLGLSFTVGRRLVFRLIRWSNDSFVSELPAISMILLITGAMALITNAIGVHLVLGAFVAGILIGQSPILTKHIDEQLRGLIIALFMPVFFGLAGLTTDLGALVRPDLALLTLSLIVFASVGKFSGAFVGGRLGGLTYTESLAVGCGMNARGSTEVVVATIGLSMGVLNQNLFTSIVAMAVVTTLAMPPMLRWSLKRLPMGDEEKARLAREEFEEQGFLTRVERLLVAVDGSASGRFASRLVGLIAGVRKIPTTVLHVDDEQASAVAESNGEAERSTETVKASAKQGDEAADTKEDEVDITTRSQNSRPAEEAIATEAKKGYGLLVIGREPAAKDSSFDPQIGRSARQFAGPFAIAVARGAHANAGSGAERGGAGSARSPGRGGKGPDDASDAPLNILVPVTGTSISRQGAEIAIALAQASRGQVTAMHVSAQRPATGNSWQRRFGRMLAPDGGGAAIREVVEIGEHYGVKVKGTVRNELVAQQAILEQIEAGKHDLLVMGVSPRPGDQLFFGDTPADILAKAKCSLLFVSSEPPATD